MAGNNNDSQVSRRSVLKGVGAGLAATTAAGQAAAAGKGAYVVGVSDDHGLAKAKRAAAEVKHEFDFDDIGKAVAGTFPEEALDGLRNNPHVRYVEADSEYRALAQTLPWGIDRVDADLAHGDGYTGDGADIAILDTGIDSDHPDLQANVQGGKCFSADCCGEASGGGGPFGCSTNSNTCNHAWDDDNDHGTHCAGIADAADNSEDVVGVSTGANLWAGKVLDGCGSGSLSSIAAGIEWAADQGFDVASMSLGASSGDQTLKDAVQYAESNGVLLVAAAGNDGPCSDCVGYPAAYSEVVAVSSTASDDTLSDFSSTGPEVELAAPGSSILSTVPPESSSDGTDTFSGTSMACPHVSGAGGILMANGQSNTEARNTLQSTAEDIGLGSNESGNGLLDAEAAANATDGGGSNSAPAVDSLSASEVETSDADAEFDVTWEVSDTDGNLSTVDLALTDDTDGTTEDTASISVSGSSAAGTTRLVAADDDGSGNSYTVDVTVTDSDGATDSATTTVSETEETNSAPAVDSLSASEVETSDADAEFDVTWEVSDTDGNLSTVDLTLTDDTDSETEDTASISVSGSTASGTTRLVAPDDDGSGNSYTVDVTVTDGDGATASDSTAVSETEDTSSAPTVDSHGVSTRTTGPWSRVTADWAVSDSDGDLDSVVVEIRDGSGSTLASTTNDVSGSTASGSDELKTRGTPSESVVTVTDAAGNSDTSTKSV